MEKHILLGNSYMNVISFGSGSKNLAVLAGVSLTGLEGLGDALEEALGIFSKDFTVYVFDRLKVLPKGYSTEDMAEDVYKCLRELGVEHTYVYGTSHGGMMGQMLAIDHPDFVDKLVMCSTISRNKCSRYDTVDRWLAASQNHDVEKLNQLFLDDVYSQEYEESIKDMIPTLLKNGTAEDCDRFTILLEAVKNFDCYESLNKIKCPVYILCDKNDHVFGPEPSIELAERLKCQIYVYDKYSHAVYDEAPDIKERILEFLLD